MRYHPHHANPPPGPAKWPAIGRRRVLGAVSALAAGGIYPARAAVAVAELVVACDTTLGPALRATGAAFEATTGVRVDVFAMDGGLILPQLERQVQNDILVARRGIMQSAVQKGLVAAAAVRGDWTDPLVIATRRGATAPHDAPVAVCDPTPACDLDGMRILERLAMRPAKTIGTIDTDTVVALVLNGTARAGLMYMTDVRGHPGLQILDVIPPDVQPPRRYAAAVTSLARRPDPARFIDFLLTHQAATLLASLGLEAAT